ncbi:nuclease domain-containing protein [Massilia oculi]|nr:nuclease domain-containing protein [Massilia oculi]
MIRTSPIARTGTLKQGKPLSRKTPMARGTGFKTPADGAGLLRVAAVQLKTRKPMKKSRAKSTPARRAARGRDCTLMLPGVCNRDPATTVLCHSNRLADGKGMALKAPDSAACFGCSDCHDVLDGRRPLPGWISRQQLDAAFDRARAITQEQLKQEGITA